MAHEKCVRAYYTGILLSACQPECVADFTGFTDNWMLHEAEVFSLLSPGVKFTFYRQLMAPPFYPHKLAITSPTSGGRSVGVVRSRTQTMEFFLWLPML
jgi:hypothetical protein